MKFSVAELEEEIGRRKRPKRPQCCGTSTINGGDLLVSDLRELCEHHFDTLEAGRPMERSGRFELALFKKAMERLYGTPVWAFLRYYGDEVLARLDTAVDRGFLK
jgi:hypothetical protein